jgi:hypothetical protein
VHGLPGGSGPPTGRVTLPPLTGMGVVSVPTGPFSVVVEDSVVSLADDSSVRDDLTPRPLSTAAAPKSGPGRWSTHVDS